MTFKHTYIGKRFGKLKVEKYSVISYGKVYLEQYLSAKDFSRNILGMTWAAPRVGMLKKQSTIWFFTCLPWCNAWRYWRFFLTRDFFLHKISILIWTTYLQGSIVEKIWRDQLVFFLGLYGISGKFAMKNNLMDASFLHGYNWPCITWMQCLVQHKSRRGIRANHRRKLTRETHRAPDIHLLWLDHWNRMKSQVGWTGFYRYKVVCGFTWTTRGPQGIPLTHLNPRRWLISLIRK